MMVRLASGGSLRSAASALRLPWLASTDCDVIAPSDDTVPVSEIVYPSDSSLVAHVGEWRRDCNEVRPLMKRSANSLPTLIESPVESHGS
jgi:hypothetical protein